VVVAAKNDFAINFAVQKAVRGTTVLLLANSGLWVNALVRANPKLRVLRETANSLRDDKLLEPRDLPCDQGGPVTADGAQVRCKIPPGCLKRFQVFDLLEHGSADRVACHLTRTLTAMSGDDQQALNFQQSEERRIRAALAECLRYSLTAQGELKWACCGQYSLAITAVLTTLFVTLLGDAEDGACGFPPWQPTEGQECTGKGGYSLLAVCCSVLPLVSAFLKSLDTQWSPYTKYTSLTAASESVLSTVYKYRARVGPFRPSMRHRELFRKWATQRQVRQEDGGGEIEPEAETPESEGGSSQQGKQGAAPSVHLQTARPRESPERTQPAASAQSPSERLTTVLSTIRTKLMVGDLKMDTLREPPKNFWEDAMKYGLQHVVAASTGRRCNCPYCPRQEQDLCSCSGRCCGSRQVAPQDADEEAQWLERHDGAYTTISAEEYVVLRLTPMTRNLKDDLVPITFRYRLYQLVSLLGTLVAGVFGLFPRLRSYIPVLVAIVSSLDMLAGFHQWRLRISCINSALTTLSNLKTWWTNLSMVEQRKWYNKDYLIIEAEAMANITATIFGANLRVDSAPQQGGEDDEEGRKKAT